MDGWTEGIGTYSEGWILSRLVPLESLEMLMTIYIIYTIYTNLAINQFFVINVNEARLIIQIKYLLKAMTKESLLKKVGILEILGILT